MIYIILPTPHNKNKKIGRNYEYYESGIMRIQRARIQMNKKISQPTILGCDEQKNKFERHCVELLPMNATRAI